MAEFLLRNWRNSSFYSFSYLLETLLGWLPQVFIWWNNSRIISKSEHSSIVFFELFASFQLGNFFSFFCFSQIGDSTDFSCTRPSYSSNVALDGFVVFCEAKLGCIHIFSICTSKICRWKNEKGCSQQMFFNGLALRLGKKLHFVCIERFPVIQRNFWNPSKTLVGPMFFFSFSSNFVASTENLSKVLKSQLPSNDLILLQLQNSLDMLFCWQKAPKNIAFLIYLAEKAWKFGNLNFWIRQFTKIVPPSHATKLRQMHQWNLIIIYCFCWSLEILKKTFSEQKTTKKSVFLQSEEWVLTQFLSV